MTLRVAMVVDRFPSEPFLAQQVSALKQRSVDVHVVCQIHDRHSEVWSILDDVDMKGKVHPWPERNELPAIAGAVIRTTAAALLTDAVGFRRAIRSEFQPLDDHRAGVRVGTDGRRKVIGRMLFDARLVAINPDVVHFQFGDLARNRLHASSAIDAAFTSSFRGYDLSYAGLDQAGFYDALWPCLDGAHTLGTDLRELAVARGCPPMMDWSIISPAIDLASFTVPDRHQRTAGSALPVQIVTVARLHWKKGIPDALLAVAELVADGHDVRYHVVGDGPAKEQLQWTIKDLGLEERVELIGQVDRAGVHEQLAAADIYLHPSLTEGFGNAVLEAQAMALPVVCTDAEGLAENVEDGVTGIVVPRHRPNQLAIGLHHLLSDPKRRLEMGQRGRARVAEYFGLEQQTDAFVEFFEKAVKRRQTPHGNGL